MNNKTFETFGSVTMKRFYQGAEHIAASIARGKNASITRDTMEDVVNDARAILARDPHRECVIVVEIVAVVYREQPPIKVDILG